VCGRPKKGRERRAPPDGSRVPGRSASCASPGSPLGPSAPDWYRGRRSPGDESHVVAHVAGSVLPSDAGEECEPSLDIAETGGDPSPLSTGAETKCLAPRPTGPGLRDGGTFGPQADLALCRCTMLLYETVDDPKSRPVCESMTSLGS
jgi:hypothetical protein